MDFYHCDIAPKVRESLEKRYGSLSMVHKEITANISEIFGRPLSLSNEVKDCTIESAYSKIRIMDSPAEESMIKMDSGDFLSAFPEVDDCPSLYDPRIGKIFLNNGTWCFNSLCHETFHGVSCFACGKAPNSNLDFVSEGLTELLTGLMLKQICSKCFSRWSEVNFCLHKPYLPDMLIWKYIGESIGLSEIVDLFFDVKEAEPYERIIQVMRKKLSTEFRDVFQPYKPSRNIRIRFLEELTLFLGESFDEYVRSRPDVIDLSRLRL